MRRQSRLRRSTLPMLLLIPDASAGEPTTIERHWARLIATFRRWDPPVLPVGGVEEAEHGEGWLDDAGVNCGR